MSATGRSVNRRHLRHQVSVMNARAQNPRSVRPVMSWTAAAGREASVMKASKLIGECRVAHAEAVRSARFSRCRRDSTALSRERVPSLTSVGAK